MIWEWAEQLRLRANVLTNSTLLLVRPLFFSVNEKGSQHRKSSRVAQFQYGQW